MYRVERIAKKIAFDIKVITGRIIPHDLTFTYLMFFREKIFAYEIFIF